MRGALQIHGLIEDDFDGAFFSKLSRLEEGFRVKRCHILHTGVGEVCEAVLLEGDELGELSGAHTKVALIAIDEPVWVCHPFMEERFRDPKLILGEKYLFTPDCLWWGALESERGMTQLVVDGKWGFANTHTGEVVLTPAWDFAAPFYNGFAMVALGCELDRPPESCPQGDSPCPSGGKYGFIDLSGEVMIPLRYDSADVFNRYGNFMVKKGGLSGVIGRNENIIVPFAWKGIDFLQEYLDMDWDGYVARRGDDRNDTAIFDFQGNLFIDGLTDYPKLYRYGPLSWIKENIGKIDNLRDLRRRYAILYSLKALSSCVLLMCGEKYGVASLLKHDRQGDYRHRHHYDKFELLAEPSLSISEAVELIHKSDFEKTLRSYAHDLCDPRLAKTTWERLHEDDRKTVTEYMELHGMDQTLVD